MQFEHTLTRSVSVVVYAEYDAVIKMDKKSNVFTYFQRSLLWNTKQLTRIIK